MARPTVIHRFLGLVLLFSLPAAGAALVLAQRTLDHRAPAAEEWKELATQVRPGLGKVDLVRVVPGWDDLGRAAFFAASPQTGTFPFGALDGRVPPDPLVWMRFKRVVIVGWSDRVDDDARSLPEGSRHLGEVGRTNRLRAVAWALPPSPLQWSAVESLESARVQRVLPNGEILACPWSAGRFDCPGGAEPWRDVRRVLTDAGDAPRDCIYAEPYPHGARVEIAFDGVRLEAGDTLLLRAGNSIEAARRRAGGRLHVTLDIDGERIVEDGFGRNDYLWTPWAVRVSEDAKVPGRLYGLVVSVSAEQSGWRQVCLDLHVLGAGWEAWGPAGGGHGHGGKPGAIPARKAQWSPGARAARRR